MEIKFISTNNEKFAYAYTLEKAIVEKLKVVVINVYGGIEEYCKKLGELRWLLKENRREIDVESINERIKFRLVSNLFELEELADSDSDSEELQFHLFPSKILPKLADYVKFLLKLQSATKSKKCKKCVLVDDIEIYERDHDFNSHGIIKNYWIYGLFPPDSIFTVTCHTASRQFEVQKWSDKGIVETIKMEWNNDRMIFHNI